MTEETKVIIQDMGNLQYWKGPGEYDWVDERKEAKVMTEEETEQFLPYLFSAEFKCRLIHVEG